MYKMLGREHQADLDREASKRALAASLPSRPRLTQRAVAWLRQLATRRTSSIARKRGLLATAAANRTSAGKRDER
jgi:hypothetical protein